jgi:EAL domain-containing protein (putative c-di-GMP-specific phosphodiesterase class I)
MAERDLFKIIMAIERHEIKPYYQPMYNTLTNKLSGAEALAYWEKPDGTIISPGHFIPPLEEQGLITYLDWYMLREVCIFLQDQIKNNRRVTSVSVNFSRKHVNEDDFVEKLCEITDQYQIPRNLIVVEITESAFADCTEKIADLIAEIRKEGFRVAIDDFGQGLSSLSFVKDVPVDILKIDKSLLSHNCEDEKERIVLESIFTFAHRLKLTTVAEGVETREQLGFLRTCGCKVIQGFLFSRPISAENFIKLSTKYREPEITDDILQTQPSRSAMQLLIDAIFIRYPLVIFSNLTRNSFYMMAYENFSAQSCPSAGVFEELIAHGATTMHPEDQEAFRTTFSIKNQMAAYQKGDKFISLVTRQLGDDGIYRRVETTNYFVKNPSVDDLLVISLCQNLE